jgi:hypothetical protein
MSLSANVPDRAFLDRARQVAADCVNQGGVEHLIALKEVIGD